jgi:hypothetical protein
MDRICGPFTIFLCVFEVVFNKPVFISGEIDFGGLAIYRKLFCKKKSADISP